MTRKPPMTPPAGSTPSKPSDLEWSPAHTTPRDGLNVTSSPGWEEEIAAYFVNGWMQSAARRIGLSLPDYGWMKSSTEFPPETAGSSKS
jgi:hypothetical protein